MDEYSLQEFFNKLDRSLFLDKPYKELADYDGPLPIGYDQTISQPSLVLEMTRMLLVEQDSRVLEIGTGSGFQTALLAEFSAEVYTIERIPELSKKAQSRLLALGYKNIFYKIGDGSSGWEEMAPFDRIMVTAAAGQKPVNLIEQLNVKGRMIIPYGPPYAQELLLITKEKDGAINEQIIGYVSFVEMVGKYGWRKDDNKDDNFD